MQCRDCEFSAQPRSIIPSEPLFTHSVGPGMKGMPDQFALFQHEIVVCGNCSTHVLLATEVFPIKKPAQWALKERQQREATLPKTS